MENASKALIMAGGMLIAILLVSLLVYAWGEFSEYQSSKDSLADVEDIAKFNEQFAQYDRNDVMGYELISLVNKVIDYNSENSNASYAQNNKNYLPISFTIYLGSDTNKIIQKFTYYGDSLLLFTDTTYVQSEKKNQIENLLAEALETESSNNFKNSQTASDIAKDMGSIFLKETNPTAKNMKNALNTFNSLVGSDNKISFDSKSASSITTAYNNMESKYKSMISKYYEYIQFKKAIFKCGSDSNNEGITYDSESGRISAIEFTWTGEIK